MLLHRDEQKMDSTLYERLLQIKVENFNDTILDFLFNPDSTKSSEHERVKQYTPPPTPEYHPMRLAPRMRNNHFSSSKRIFSEGEKKRILSRVEHRKCPDEEQRQLRIARLRDRNKMRYIGEVKRRASILMNEVVQKTLAVIQQEQKRRDEILFRSQNFATLRQISRYLERVQLWYQIVTTYVFVREFMKARAEHDALECLRRLFKPVVYIHLMKRRAEKELRMYMDCHPEIVFPSAATIKQMKGLFFDGWPSDLLQHLGDSSTPLLFRQGRCLIHADNHDRSMFMVTNGCVSIVFRSHKIKDKRRTKANSDRIILLEAPCYVGEFGLVYKETRTATVYCETDMVVWRVTPEEYEHVAQYLTPELAQRQREVTDARRKHNLKKIFSLRVDYIRTHFSFFTKFSDEALQKISDNVDPVVLHSNEVLFHSGIFDPSAYFIQEGDIREVDEKGNENRIGKGEILGIFECACSVNEKKRKTVYSTRDADIWRLPRELLLDIGMTEPHAFVECRAAAKAVRAREIIKDDNVPFLYRSDPYLSFCFVPSLISKIYRASHPIIYTHGECITQTGSPLNAFITIIRGTVDVRMPTHEGIDVFRMSGDFLPEHDKKIEEEQLKKLVKDRDPLGHKGLSFCLGAYEFVASLGEYACTVTAYGVIEALVTDIRFVHNLVPPSLRKIMIEHQAGRDAIKQSHQRQDLKILSTSKISSFAHLYKPAKEKKKRKN